MFYDICWLAFDNGVFTPKSIRHLLVFQVSSFYFSVDEVPLRRLEFLNFKFLKLDSSLFQFSETSLQIRRKHFQQVQQIKHMCLSLPLVTNIGSSSIFLIASTMNNDRLIASTMILFDNRTNTL